MKPWCALALLLPSISALATPLWLGVVNETGTLIPVATYKDGKITAIWKEPVPPEFFRQQRLRRVPREWLAAQGAVPDSWQVGSVGSDANESFPWSAITPYQAACRKGWGLETPLGEQTRAHLALSPGVPSISPLTEDQRSDVNGLDKAVKNAWAAESTMKAGAGVSPKGSPVIQVYAMPKSPDGHELYYVEVFPPPLGKRGRPAWSSWAQKNGELIRLEDTRSPSSAGSYRLALGFVPVDGGVLALFENGEFGKVTYTVESITLSPLSVKKERQFSGGGC